MHLEFLLPFLLDAFFKDFDPGEHLDDLDILQALRNQAHSLLLRRHVPFLESGIESANAKIAKEADEEDADADEENDAEVVVEEPESHDEYERQLDKA